MTDDARIVEKALRQLIHAPFLEERDVALRALDRLTAELARKDEALKPFAEYAPSAPPSIFPDDAPFTQGSPLAKRQLTFGDLRRARAALAPMEKKNG